MPRKAHLHPREATQTCPGCQKQFKALHWHTPFCEGRGEAPQEEGAAAVAVKVPSPAPVAGEPRSARGRRRMGVSVLRPIDQIRMQPNGLTGAWCYYLRPEGATIRDALILSPNWGAPDRIADPKGRFGMNANHYRAIAAQKGFVYLGQRLDARAVRLLVETMARNREDEILFCEDEIVNCQAVLDGGATEREKAVAAKRKRQYQTRMETLLAKWEPKALIEELNDIARAQRLSSIDPNLLAVMSELVDERNTKLAALVQRFTAGKTAPGADAELVAMGVQTAPGGVRAIRSRGMAAAAVEEFVGVNEVDET